MGEWSLVSGDPLIRDRWLSGTIHDITAASLLYLLL